MGKEDPAYENQLHGLADDTCFVAIRPREIWWDRLEIFRHLLSFWFANSSCLVWLEVCKGDFYFQWAGLTLNLIRNASWRNCVLWYCTKYGLNEPTVNRKGNTLHLDDPLCQIRCTNEILESLVWLFFFPSAQMEPYTENCFPIYFGSSSPEEYILHERESNARSGQPWSFPSHNKTMSLAESNKDHPP